MRTTFNLRKPKDSKPTLILFSTYFKNERKKFVYSTGESILPTEWDFDNRQPNNLKGRTENAEQHRVIKRQIDRYEVFFAELVNRYKNINEELDIETTRKEFDKEFKRVEATSNNFFLIYDRFMESKRNNHTDTANSESTIMRYDYHKTILKEFQEYRKKDIHFNKINASFYNEYIHYCVTVKKHSSNTLRRNVGLFKTFLNWALENNHTYNAEFKKFKSPKAQATDEVALTLDQVKEIYTLDLSEKKKLERVRDIFVFGCSTGMRISNYSKVSKNDIEDGYIKVVDKKNNDKYLKIPLNDFSLEILEKYDYKLPVISTQKFNTYIKDVFKEAGYKHEIKKITKVGNEVIETPIPFYDRISSHTARRSFITIMKNKKIPDKVIMEFTGHKSLEVFNKYYKPNEDDKKDFMANVWSK
ncbi:tyrosine-type recombinase/integrase [Mangrovimonas aestuarii]|uniref:tyrosine-type recombinase/integrase n=1 Tax=Mangrovimonas aestuarii TaxID=3018443 RepID=UPI002378E0D9|nr:tyrosine-type recombinase/integrase [Mangrovimonas aestuarii]